MSASKSSEKGGKKAAGKGTSQESARATIDLTVSPLAAIIASSLMHRKRYPHSSLWIKVDKRPHQVHRPVRLQKWPVHHHARLSSSTAYLLAVLRPWGLR